MADREDLAIKERRVTGGVILATFVALMLLALLSFLLSFAHLGKLAIVVALVIAVVKATLVALFFMELVAEKFTIRIALVAGLAFLFLLTGFMVADIGTRSIPPVSSPTTPGRSRF